MTGRPEDIRIQDLASPELTPMQQAAIEGAGKATVSFTEASILEAAAAQTGLDDFGPDDFRERLRVLLVAQIAQTWFPGSDRDPKADAENERCR